jgi:hypothetical protein
LSCDLIGVDLNVLFSVRAVFLPSLSPVGRSWRDASKPKFQWHWRGRLE